MLNKISRLLSQLENDKLSFAQVIMAKMVITQFCVSKKHMQSLTVHMIKTSFYDSYRHFYGKLDFGSALWRRIFLSRRFTHLRLQLKNIKNKIILKFDYINVFLSTLRSFPIKNRCGILQSKVLKNLLIRQIQKIKVKISGFVESKKLIIFKPWNC